MRRLASAAAAVVLAATLAGAPAAQAQCSMCRASVENSEEGRRVAGDLNRAILLMFLAPYAVFGTFATLLFRRRITGLLRQRLSSRSG